MNGSGIDVDTIAWPIHKGSLSIEHNNHLTNYQTIRQLLRDQGDYYDASDFPAGEMDRCIETGSLWTIHWYPDTPVGFCVVHASTLGACLRAALA